MRHILRLAAILAATLTAAPVAAQELGGLARLDASRSYARDLRPGGGTELRLALSQGVPWRVFTLDDPARLARAVEALTRVATVLPLVMPLHPRTRAKLEGAGLYARLAEAPGLHLCDALGYVAFQSLLAGARLAITDSGGLQKEAYFHRVPCITLRDETEWVETVDAGWNRLWQAPETDAPRREITDYGDGNAAGRIAQAAAAYLDEGS